MVRVGGLSYACAPANAVGSRISDLTLESGKHLVANRRYKVAGWASVNPQAGAPVWEVVGKYLRSGRMLPERLGSGVTLKGVDDNPGITGQG
jgi:sulfur-oxidizing protein SoxB